jgi:hypothetical protein
MDDDEARALERIEIDAAADLWRAAPDAVRADLGIALERVGDAACFVCRDLQPATIFRRVVGLGVERPAGAADLDAIGERMRAIGQPWTIGLPPFARPPGLADELARRGFAPGYAWMKFARAADALPQAPTDLAVRRLEPADGAAFAAVVADTFGFGPRPRPWLAALAGRARWSVVGAFDADRLVAAGAVFVDGAYAWLGFAATLAAYRGRGAQNALLARRIGEAAALGARIVVTETGERVPDKPSASYRNILRAGFVEKYLRRHFVAPA